MWLNFVGALKRDGKIALYLANAIFFLQILLLFLLLFESKLSLPDWLQPIGRLHPLVLHLPIGFLFSLIGLQFVRKQIDEQSFLKINSLFIYVTSLASAITAIIGIFLAQENGYDSDAVQWHKWSGAAFSLFTYTLVISDRSIFSKRIYQSLLGASALIVLITGHQGGSLTHGQDFIWEPWQEEPLWSPYDTTVFVGLIQPILKERCMGCHNERKAKGDLIMTNTERLLEGGKNGPIWVAGDTENSPLVQRLHLPIEEKKHMPPKSKPQPSFMEIELLESWISEGASLEKNLNDYLTSPTYPIFESAMDMQMRSAEIIADYDFPRATKKIIEKLNHPFCTVKPLAANSPALTARIFCSSKLSTSIFA